MTTTPCCWDRFSSMSLSPTVEPRATMPCTRRASAWWATARQPCAQALTASNRCVSSHPCRPSNQRRAGARPLDPVRRPILPGPSADRSRADGTLYRVKYEDAEVREALLRLRDPLAAIGVVSDKVAEPESIYGLVRILVSELLHLYQYQERRQEQEARLLVNLPVCSPLIQMDDNDPGRLTYVPRICCSPVTARAYLCPPTTGTRPPPCSISSTDSRVTAC